jgi:phage recombination protein Bet
MSDKPSLLAKFSERYAVDAGKMMETLKSTAFRQANGVVVTNEQMLALLVVADQYQLNPFTREIYAFPDKGGIVPVVGVDGWSRIINSHPHFDGMDFEQDDERCTCVIYRKDRAHPIRVTEYLSECRRNTQPWQSHPRRMLRHKAMIQCTRLAFGFVGIYDQDEAERITETRIVDSSHTVVEPQKQLQPITDDRLNQAIAAINSGSYTAARLHAAYQLTPAQEAALAAGVEAAQ